MNTARKSSSMFRFFMILGCVLGVLFAVPLGSLIVGLPIGLCLSFFSGIVYSRSLEMTATIG